MYDIRQVNLLCSVQAMVECHCFGTNELFNLFHNIEIWNECPISFICGESNYFTDKIVTIRYQSIYPSCQLSMNNMGHDDHIACYLEWPWVSWFMHPFNTLTKMAYNHVDKNSSFLFTLHLKTKMIDSSIVSFSLSCNCFDNSLSKRHNTTIAT